MTKILMISTIASDGTSYYRAWGPYLRIEDAELIEFSGDINWNKLIGIDVAVVQRPPDQYFVKVIQELKRLNIPIILDYDDAIMDVEITNPVHEFYQEDEKRAAMLECIRLADVVTVSTQALRDNLLSYVPEARIVVIQNATDDYFFDLTPSDHIRNKTIAIRGGSSHSEDWGLYKDAIIEIMEEHPDYTLSVLGYHPEWLRAIPNNQLRLYQFESIANYFEKLMELKPEIAIAPLVDSKFNRCKSNVAFQEFTVAGATVIATDLPEFNIPGCLTFNSSDHLKNQVRKLIQMPGFRESLYRDALNHVPRLSHVNEHRKDIIEELIASRKKKGPLLRILPPATDKQFHDHELAYGYTQGFENHDKLSERLADYFINSFNPTSALELGCGTGGTLLHLLKRNVNAFGFEINPYSVQYFKDRYPVYRDQVLLTDITKEPVENNGIGDLVYSIEVFEHIAMPEEWWNGYLTDLSKKFKNFYFSSTPYYTVESFDAFWGHINIRTNGAWCRLFEANGWKFVGQPRMATNWDLLFKSTNC